MACAWPPASRQWPLQSGRVVNLTRDYGLKDRSIPPDPRSHGGLDSKCLAGHCRVCDPASSSLENCSPCRRDHEPHSPCVRRGMFRSRLDPRLARRAAAARPLTGGASAPVRPTHPSSALQSTARQAVKSRRQSCALRQRRCSGRINRAKKPLSRIGRVRSLGSFRESPIRQRFRGCSGRKAH